jgi:hypothetical protein
MKPVSRRTLAALLVASFLVPAVSEAQFGFGGIVYDPTNYANAVLRYKQLIQQLMQLEQTYALALQMSQYIRNMPQRYQAAFSQWRQFTSGDIYGNTTPWVSAVNGAGPQTVSPAYEQAIVPFVAMNEATLRAINPNDALQLRSSAASLELMDGANVSALTTVGNIRANAPTVEQQIDNLEQDSFSADADLNSEVDVLNKINASNVLTLRTLQDANNLRVAELEEEVLRAKFERDSDAANINFAAQINQQASQNLSSFNTNLTQSLSSYRLP